MPNFGNRGKGRPKGAINKTTASVKAALVEAFEGTGGLPAFIRWAKKNPTDFYKLYAKMLPQEHDIKGGVKLRIVEQIIRADKPLANGHANGAALPGAGRLPE